ncbi:TPA: restriction endonuclease subunit S [Streptococcus suis]|nr:restriction endonuclease subunit S [Streptococcus suis]
MNKQDIYKLEEFCNFKYGKMPERSKISEDNSLYPIYSGYKIVGYYEDWNIEKGSLLVVARGVGGTGDVKLSPAKCYLTNLSISIEVDNNIALNEFLYYYWKIRNLRYLDSGSAQSQITINDLKKVEVNLPSIDVQKEIVSILKAFDDKIDNNKMINHHLVA